MLKQALCCHEARETKSYKITDNEYVFYPWFCSNCGKYVELEVKMEAGSNGRAISILNIKQN